MLKSGDGTGPPQRRKLLLVLNEERPRKGQGIDGNALEAFLRSWHKEDPLSSHEQVVRSGHPMTAYGRIN